MGLFTPAMIAELVIAVSFAAGLNVYATVATLGIMGRMDWVVLPSGLDAVTNSWVIGVALLLFSAEFFADKIPGFDLVWNAAHTFVRLPVAALLAYGATSHLSPQLQVLATVLGAGVATIAHSSKVAARVVVTPSPEPISNIALSAAEDAGAIGLTWAATHHPFAAAALVGVAILAAVLMVRWTSRVIRSWWRGVQSDLPWSQKTNLARQPR